MRRQEEPQYNQQNPSVDVNELYNGMAVQLGYDNIHSQNWYAEQEAQDKEYDAAEIRAEENSQKSAIENMGMTPAPEPEVRHINKDVDFDIYNGKSLLQVGDHVIDSDDIVPEFSEEQKPEEAE